MRHLDTHHDDPIARTLIARIRSAATRRWAIMEVCGGHTHTIVKQRLAELVASTVEMLHDPHCPACFSPSEQTAQALRLATEPNIIFTSLGDILRTPSRERDIHMIRAGGGQTRTVYSPLDALDLAAKHPDREVVFFSAGFETTAPANAMAVWHARQRGVRNFSMLVSHVTVPPAMVRVLESADNHTQAFLAPAHVCSVTGWMAYEPVATKYRVPIVVTGLEPVDILEGIYLVVRQLEEGRHEVENQFVRSARREGTPPARDLVAKVFQLVDRSWDGTGIVPASGLALRPEFAAYDAARRFGLADPHLGAIPTRHKQTCAEGPPIGASKPPCLKE